MMKEKHKFKNEVDSRLQDMVKMFSEEELLPPIQRHHNSKIHRRNARKSTSRKVKSSEPVTNGQNSRLETICMENRINI